MFFADTDFHQSVAQRVAWESFGDRQIPVLSIEDLLICKVLFNRPKDWQDVAKVLETELHTLDHG